MNILILTYGSRGDVQPFVALGKGLQTAGHRVTLATSVRFRAFVRGHGLNYAYMNDDALSIIDTDEGKALLEKGSNLFEIIKRGVTMQKRVKPAQQALLRESWEAAQKSNPDFIIFHSKGGAGPHIAEKLGIRCVLATLIPMFLPTSAFRFPIFPDLHLGGWYNRATYRLIQLITNWVLGGYIQNFRKEMGLPHLKTYDFLKTADGQDVPVIHAHSETVLPRPIDWPEQAHVTGYWFLEEPPDWTPPQDLMTFLKAGSPPIYIGFGSMAGRNPERLAQIVVGALQKAGARGIIATGWGGLKSADLPESILKIDQAPHHWLFPKVAAVVHHGGAGTTAAGLRAGKPSIIVPFFADQPFWGERVHELGAGPKPISQKKLSVDTLAKAMRKTTTIRSMLETAADIGMNIRQEDGVANAVALIEKYASGPRKHMAMP